LIQRAAIKKLQVLRFANQRFETFRELKKLLCNENNRKKKSPKSFNKLNLIEVCIRVVKKWIDHRWNVAVGRLISKGKKKDS
jgi:hypothetical protein